MILDQKPVCSNLIGLSQKGPIKINHMFVKKEKLSEVYIPPSGAPSDKIFDGYLEKRGGKVTVKWQKRYFCIRGLKLIYGKTDKELLDSIDRSEIGQIESIPLPIAGFYTFRVKSVKKTYEMRTKSKPERDSWIDILERWKKGEFDNQLKGKPEKNELGIDDKETNSIQTMLEKQEGIEKQGDVILRSQKDRSGSVLIMPKPSPTLQDLTAGLPSNSTIGKSMIGSAPHMSMSFRFQNENKELFDSLTSIPDFEEDTIEVFNELPQLKPFYWEHIGEKNEFVDIDSKIIATKEEISNVKTKFTTSHNKHSLDILHFEPADRTNVESNILSFIYGESKVATQDVVFEKRVYWSGKVISQTIDEKNKFKDTEMSLVLTWGNIILFDGLLNEVDRIPIPKIQYIIQDRLDFRKVALLTYTHGDEGEDLKSHDYLLFFDTQEKKIDFFHYFSSAFYSFDGKTPNIWFVEGIETYVRIGETSIRPKVKRVTAEDILYIHDAQDYLNIKNEKESFEEIIKSGDTEVLFSSLVEKPGEHSKANKDRKWCLTDQGMYIFSGKNPRRIDLDEISHVYYRENGDKITDIVFRIPAEYDLHIRIAQDKANKILSILQDDLFDGLECEKVFKDIHTKAQTTKSHEYKEELKKLKNANYITNGLMAGIKSKNKRDLIKLLRHSNKLDNNAKKDLTVIINEAEKVLRELKESRLSQEQFMEAINKRDLTRLFDLSASHTFEEIYMKKFYRIVNEEVMAMKIEDMIKAFDYSVVTEKKIKLLMTLARKWGLIHIVDQLKVSLNKKIQQDNTIRSLKTSFEKNDLNEIRIMLMNAEMLEIPETNPTIVDAKKRLPILLLEAQLRRDIKDTKNVDDLIEIATTSTFKSLAFDQQQKLQADIQEQKNILEFQEKKGKWLNVVEAEIKILQKKIRSRDDAITGLNALDDLNRILKDIPSKDLKIPESVNTTIDLVKKTVKSYYKKKCDQIRPELEKAIANKDEETIETLLERYKEHEHESLRDLASQGQKFLDYCKKERELCLLLSIAIKVSQDPYKTNSFYHISKITHEANEYPKLEEVNSKLAQELKNLYQSKKCEEILDEAMLSLDPTLIKGAIEQARPYIQLREKINYAYKVMSSNEEKNILISNKLDEALQEGDRRKIMKVIYAAKAFPNLKTKVSQAIEILKSDRYKIERETELYLLLEEKQHHGDHLDEFISLNAEFLTDNELNIAKKALLDIRQREYSLIEMKSNLTKAIAARDKKLLATAIMNAESITTDNKELLSVLQNAKDLLQKLNMGYVNKLKEELNQIDLDSDDEIGETGDTTMLRNIVKQTQSVTINRQNVRRHPFIDELHWEIQGLMSELKDGDMVNMKWEIEMENARAQQIVKLLYQILSDKTSSSFLYGPKSLWEIFANFKSSPLIVKYIEFFSALDVVKKLPESGKDQALASLFIHYTLHKGVLLEMIQQIMSDERYLASCYGNESIIRAMKHRDDLFSTLALLFQFHFKFDLSTSGDVLIAHPLARLKAVVKNIVGSFLITSESESETAKRNIINLVKKEFYNELMSIVNFGFYSRTLFGRYHIWDVIEESAKLKQVSAMDYGGILLPSIVSRVSTLSDDKDIRFKLFLYAALNEKTLGDLLVSIFSPQMISKYYAKNAIVNEEETFDKIIDLLTVLTKLEFRFDLNALIKDGL